MKLHKKAVHIVTMEVGTKIYGVSCFTFVNRKFAFSLISRIEFPVMMFTAFNDEIMVAESMHQMWDAVLYL